MKAWRTYAEEAQLVADMDKAVESLHPKPKVPVEYPPPSPNRRQRRAAHRLRVLAYRKAAKKLHAKNARQIETLKGIAES